MKRVLPTLVLLLAAVFVAAVLDGPPANDGRGGQRHAHQPGRDQAHDAPWPGLCVQRQRLALVLDDDHCGVLARVTTPADAPWFLEQRYPAPGLDPGESAVPLLCAPKTGPPGRGVWLRHLLPTTVIARR